MENAADKQCKISMNELLVSKFNEKLSIYIKIKNGIK